MTETNMRHGHVSFLFDCLEFWLATFLRSTEDLGHWRKYGNYQFTAPSVQYFDSLPWVGAVEVITSWMRRWVKGSDHGNERLFWHAAYVFSFQMECQNWRHIPLFFSKTAKNMVAVKLNRRVINGDRSCFFGSESSWALLLGKNGAQICHEFDNRPRVVTAKTVYWVERTIVGGRAIVLSTECCHMLVLA